MVEGLTGVHCQGGGPTRLRKPLIQSPLTWPAEGAVAVLNLQVITSVTGAVACMLKAESPKNSTG
jgi:hypothetical protein